MVVGCARETVRFLFFLLSPREKHTTEAEKINPILSFLLHIGLKYPPLLTTAVFRESRLELLAHSSQGLQQKTSLVLSVEWEDL